MTKNEFFSTWLRRFANGISSEKIEKYVVSTGNYLWHVFSWELLIHKKERTFVYQKFVLFLSKPLILAYHHASACISSAPLGLYLITL